MGKGAEGTAGVVSGGGSEVAAFCGAGVYAEVAGSEKMPALRIDGATRLYREAAGCADSKWKVATRKISVSLSALA